MDAEEGGGNGIVISWVWNSRSARQRVVQRWVHNNVNTLNTTNLYTGTW